MSEDVVLLAQRCEKNVLTFFLNFRHVILRFSKVFFLIFPTFS